MIVELGCICCGAPAEVYHCRTGLGMSQRLHSRILPICEWHHRTGPSSILHNKPLFEELHGTEAMLEAALKATLGEI